MRWAQEGGEATDPPSCLAQGCDGYLGPDSFHGFRGSLGPSEGWGVGGSQDAVVIGGA